MICVLWCCTLIFCSEGGVFEGGDVCELDGFGDD